MKKLFKLMTITAIATMSSLQTVACAGDNSKYNEFISYVNETKANHSAFFGFLGTLDDTDSKTSTYGQSFILQTAIDAFLQTPTGGTSQFDAWYKNNRTTISDAGFTNLSIHYFQGQQTFNNNPSNAVNDFWNDKKISWQKNIFHWIYNQKGSYLNPIDNKQGVQILSGNLDPNDKKNHTYMFSALPVIFIIANGKVLVAGQQWGVTTLSIDNQIQNIESFLIENLLNNKK